MPWLGYPIVSSEVGGLGSSGRAPQEVLGLSLGKMVSSSQVFVGSPEYGLVRLVQATGKIGCCHEQQTAEGKRLAVASQPAFALERGRSWVEAGQELSLKWGSPAAVPVAAPICSLPPVVAATETLASQDSPSLTLCHLIFLFYELGAA